MRQRNNQYTYEVEVSTPLGEIETLTDMKNLEDIALYINTAYFNGFEVVSRSMVSNWIYMPNKSKRQFANRFNIKKVDNSTTTYPISA